MNLLAALVAGKSGPPKLMHDAYTNTRLHLCWSVIRFSRKSCVVWFYACLHVRLLYGASITWRLPVLFISGKYLYLEATSHVNQTARLDSKEYPAGDYCIDFYYHMYGSDMGSLSLNILSGTHIFHLKTWSGNQGNQWYHQRLNVHIHASVNIKVGDIIEQEVWKKIRNTKRWNTVVLTLTLKAIKRIYGCKNSNKCFD